MFKGEEVRFGCWVQLGFGNFEQLVVWGGGGWGVKFFFGIEIFRNGVIDFGYNFEYEIGSRCCRGQELGRRCSGQEQDFIVYVFYFELGVDVCSVGFFVFFRIDY